MTLHSSRNFKLQKSTEKSNIKKTLWHWTQLLDVSEDALVFVLELQVPIIGIRNCTNVSVFQTRGNNGPYRAKKITSNTGRADSVLEGRWETQNSTSVFQSFSPNTGFVSGHNSHPIQSQLPKEGLPSDRYGKTEAEEKINRHTLWVKLLHLASIKFIFNFLLRIINIISRKYFDWYH